MNPCNWDKLRVLFWFFVLGFFERKDKLVVLDFWFIILFLLLYFHFIYLFIFIHTLFINRRAFEDEEKSVVQLLEFCQKTLFDWSHCWGFSDCSSLTDFISSIRID